MRRLAELLDVENFWAWQACQPLIASLGLRCDASTFYSMFTVAKPEPLDDKVWARVENSRSNTDQGHLPVLDPSLPHHMRVPIILHYLDPDHRDHYAVASGDEEMVAARLEGQRPRARVLGLMWPAGHFG